MLGDSIDSIDFSALPVHHVSRYRGHGIDCLEICQDVCHLYGDRLLPKLQIFIRPPRNFSVNLKRALTRLVCGIPSNISQLSSNFKSSVGVQKI